MSEERKYNHGAKIILIISILMIPMQLITSALISRISSEASGILGVLEIFYNAIISFFIFGGENAIIKLLTNKNTKTQKKNFIIKYIIITSAIFVTTIVITKICHFDFIKKLTGQLNSTSIFMYGVGLLIIINNILLYYLKEEEKFSYYAFGIKLFNIGNFLSVVYIFFFCKNIDVQNTLLVFMGLLQLLSTIIILIKEKIVYQKETKEERAEKRQIENLKFIFFLYLSTLLVFIYDKIDQIILVKTLGLATLGGYYLIVKVVNMVKLLPNTYNSTFYPYICKYLNKESSNYIFNNILSKNLFFIFPLTIIIVLNSKLIINILFGAEYINYNFTLQFLTTIILISAPTIILNNFLYALGKTKKYFQISFIAIAVQVIIIISTIKYIGINAILIARFVSTFIIFIFCKLYLNKLQYSTKLPKTYYRYSAVILVSLAITNLLKLNIIFNIILSIIILIIYMIENKNYVINNYKKIKDRFGKIKGN